MRLDNLARPTIEQAFRAYLSSVSARERVEAIVILREEKSLPEAEIDALEREYCGVAVCG